MLPLHVGDPRGASSSVSTEMWANISKIVSMNSWLCGILPSVDIPLVSRGVQGQEHIVVFPKKSKAQKVHASWLVGCSPSSQGYSTNIAVYCASCPFNLWNFFLYLGTSWISVGDPLFVSISSVSSQENFPPNDLDQLFLIYLINPFQFNCLNRRVHTPKCVIIKACLLLGDLLQRWNIYQILKNWEMAIKCEDKQKLDVSAYNQCTVDCVLCFLMKEWIHRFCRIFKCPDFIYRVSHGRFDLKRHSC